MLSALLALGIFVADVSMLHGVVIGVFHVAVILLSLWTPQQRFTLITAVMCSALTGLGHVFSPAHSTLWQAFINRLIVLFAIWVTAILVLQRKRTVHTLRLSEERFRHLIEGSIQGILIHRVDTPLFVNQAYADMFGSTTDAILRMPSLLPLVAPHDRERLVAYGRASLQGRAAPMHYEYQGVRTDGRLIWLENRVRVVDWDRLPALQSTVVDITERKRAEEALRASQRSFARLLGSLPGMAYRCRHDRDRRMEFLSDGCAAVTGYQPDDLINNRTVSYGQLLHPDDRDVVWQAVQTALRHHTPFRLTYRITTASGDVRWVWEQGSEAATTPDGAVLLEGFMADVTDRKQAEDALAMRVRQMEAVRAVSVEITRELDLTVLLELIIRRAVDLVDSAGAGVVFLWDEPDQVLAARASHGLGAWIESVRLRLGEGVTGYVAEHREGLLVNAYDASPHASAPLKQYVRDTAVLAEPLLYHGRLLGVITLGNAGTRQSFTDQDQELLGLFGTQAAIAIENARLFREVQEQATRLQAANAALNENQERYRAFVSQSFEGIWRFEHDAPIPVTLSEDAQIALLYERAYLAECNEVMARMYGFPSADAAIGARIDTLLERTNPDNIEFLRHYIRHGYRLIEAESHDLDQQGQPQVFLNNLWGIVEDGHLVRTWGIQRDITERRRFEERLLQTQKMAAMGTLAGGVAHDFNNILAAILGYTELALYDSPPGSPVHANLQEVLTAGKRAKELVQQILIFSRRTEQQRSPVQLAPLVREVLTIVRASLPATIEIRPHLQREVGAVLANATQIHQVLLNLCANAAYTMRQTGGRLEVRLEAVEVDAALAAGHPELRPGPYVRLTVKDTGDGIEPDILGRIFEPFFTTKEVGEGPGMGLAVVHGIVVNHGGAILVESTLGQGATFAVYLPRVAPVEDASPSRETHLPRGNGRILFVDDESALVQLGHATLTALGYEVVTHEDASEALATFRRAPGSFDLVITDQTMPHMTGEALAQTLRQIRSDIPVILCSGYGHIVDADKASGQGIDAFLLKPVDLHDLARTVQEVIAPRQTPPD